ncbi:class I SAM-dependent methyltransferase [Salibacterium qingdaonense]|uniref:Methyltransferase domain-containing protein n=1 Tax=Salibacterium qingdaonense TaxID=266892 RepID=A0A1I4I4K1_9BACI|nr:class I SAM-dependent methyltransferase [Salibacterium qingdaonense]SFL49362.1 Methyltransferase domain-containing protein [Salibacterium qingdaonense]
MLEDTGERIIPKEMKPENGLLLEHLARYTFALPYVKGRVLDIAAGTGYGAQMTAKKKKKEISEIVGVDVDPETIRYAKQHYYHPLLTFQTADALDPDMEEELGTFDTILSFETIEHVPDDQVFLQNILNLLRPGGTLVLSTPFGQGRGKPSRSPFHYHQITEEEFRDLFQDYPATSFYYQRGVTIEPKREGLHYPLGVAVCQNVDKQDDADILQAFVQHSAGGPEYVIKSRDNVLQTVDRDTFLAAVHKLETKGT